MFPFVDCLPALAVILDRPHLRPQLAVIGGHHPPFTAGSHDLVLAERPCTYVTNRADRAPFVARAMCLGAVFDNLEAMLVYQRHNRVHVAWPAREMYTDHRPGTWGQHSADGFGCYVLRLTIHLSKHRNRTAI